MSALQTVLKYDRGTKNNKQTTKTWLCLLHVFWQRSVTADSLLAWSQIPNFLIADAAVPLSFGFFSHTPHGRFMLCSSFVQSHCHLFGLFISDGSLLSRFLASWSPCSKNSLAVSINPLRMLETGRGYKSGRFGKSVAIVWKIGYLTPQGDDFACSLIRRLDFLRSASD